MCSWCTRCVFAQQERAPPSSATTPRPLCGACRPGLCKACWTLTTSAPETSPRWLPWSTLSRESCHPRKAADGCQVAFSHLISLTETELGSSSLFPFAGEATGVSHILEGSFPVAEGRTLPFHLLDEAPPWWTPSPTRTGCADPSSAFLTGGTTSRSFTGVTRRS